MDFNRTFDQITTVITTVINAGETEIRVDIDPVQQALDYVFEIKNGNCGHGTAEVLPLQFDVTAWNQLADPAIRTANLLSKVITRNGGKLDVLTDDIIFLMVRNNVHGDSLIFGSAIAVEKGVYSKYEIFCPYAYKKNNTVRSHDISINYDYLDLDTEWYNSVKVKNWDGVTMATDGISYRNGNESLPEVEEVYPIAQLSDGHWTNPYYDCGGGDVWMVTYSSPIFDVISGQALFRGVATIDIELTYIDINQCDHVNDGESSGIDVFRGTHKCHPSTKCVPLVGMGFVPGSYICECRDGFYFPFPRIKTSKTYSGEEIESYFRDHGGVNSDIFQCVACATGCDSCVDGSPCLFELNDALVVILLLINGVCLAGIVLLGCVVYLYRSDMAIKSASPIFLEIMCLGAATMYTQFFLEHLNVNLLVCSVRIWPLHLGFVVMFGSLIVKTWRVSMIFTIGTSKRVNLPDQVLLQRFGCLVLVFTAILAVWTGTSQPEVKTLRTSGQLKFYNCYYGVWEYSVIGVEIVFLLYGVYLCFTVRKAPAYFNESKHITWAVYNAIILGSFMTLLTTLFSSILGPNIILVCHFAQIQVYATITTLLIFAPKFMSMVWKHDHQSEAPTSLVQRTITGRAKKTQISPLPVVMKSHPATQTVFEI